MNVQEREQIGLDCIDLIMKKMERKITREEYYAGLMELHLQRHEPPLTTFQLENFRSIRMTVKDRDTGVIYQDHLFPFNFQEAAEMFIRHTDKLKRQAPPISVWKKKEWPMSMFEWKNNEAAEESELTGPMAIEFEKKRKNAQEKIQKERLPYKEDDTPF